MSDPAIVSPPQGKFTENEMAAWSQHVGVSRVMLTDTEYEDQYMLVRSLHSVDALNHFVKHGFKYRGRLAFNVSFVPTPILPVSPNSVPALKNSPTMPQSQKKTERTPFEAP